MSHELKHPLNLIQVHAEQLTRLPELQALPAVRRAADSIRGAVRSQAKIVDDLLDLSRARTGKLGLNAESVPICAALKAIVEAARGDAEAKNIALTWVCDEPENLQLQCDRIRTEQIVRNLLGNAIEFTPEGGRVTVELARDGADIRLRVQDDGRGIAAEYLPHVFGLFSQESERRREFDHGLAIGLALVQELTQAQGGRVKAESAGVDQGSVFTVWLPLVAQTATRSVPVLAPSDVLAGLRVLVVEDMPDALGPFVALLEGEGAEVDAAGSGEQALALLTQGVHALLVSDVGTPGVDGLELIAAVRADARAAVRGIRAVALTGYGRQADAERALRAGFDAHMAKPVDFEGFKRLVGGLTALEG